jgi:hypothetical protein
MLLERVSLLSIHVPESISYSILRAQARAAMFVLKDFVCVGKPLRVICARQVFPLFLIYAIAHYAIITPKGI